MAQRQSGYARKERDLYETPEWVTLALMANIPMDRRFSIWEPACASGKIARVVNADYATDLVTNYEFGEDGVDFLKAGKPPFIDSIITNPPFNKDAEKFIRYGRELLKDGSGIMAMLLPVDFDSARGRKDIFNDCPYFATKLVLTSRIVWIERTDGKKAAPSQNHAWFIWDFAKHPQAEPIIRYHFT